MLYSFLALFRTCLIGFAWYILQLLLAVLVQVLYISGNRFDCFFYCFSTHLEQFVLLACSFLERVYYDNFVSVQTDFNEF